MASTTGTLIKKSDKNKIKLLILEEYPWLSFTKRSFITPDNLRKNVVLKNFHSEQEWKKNIKDYKKMKVTFPSKSKTLLPQDMTKDYIASLEELSVRRKRRMIDEEDNTGIGIADIGLLYDESPKDERWNREKIQSRGVTTTETTSTTPESPVVSVTPPSSPQAETISQPTQTSTKKIDDTKIKPYQFSSFSTEGKLSSQKKEETPLTEIEEEKIPDVLIKQASNAEISSITKNTPEPFFKEEQTSDSAPAPLPEKEAEIQVQQAIPLEETEEFITFQEEKKQYTEQVLNSVARIKEIETKFKSHAEDIFLEIVKTASEKILREELKSNPDILKKLITPLLDDLKGLETTVQIHPSDRPTIEKLMADKNIHLTLKDNNTLKPGDFSVENAQSVIATNIQTKIEKLIEELRPALFSTEQTDKDKKEG